MIDQDRLNPAQPPLRSQRAASAASLEKGPLPMKRSIASEAGGVILEYVLVTTFALFIGGAALAYVTKLVRERLEQMEEAMSESEQASFDDLLDGP